MKPAIQAVIQQTILNQAVAAQEQEGYVLCMLPNGDELEITMLEACGEEFEVKTNAQEALNLLTEYKQWSELWMRKTVLK